MDPAEFLLGITSTVAFFISLFVGVEIALKYREYRVRAFIFIGIASIIIAEPWWPQLINFYLELLNIGGLSKGQGYIIGMIGIPIGIFAWLFAFTDLIYKEKQRLILIISGVSGIFYDIFLIIFLYIDPNLTGTTLGLNNSYIILGYLFACSITILTTGLIFSRESIKSEDPIIKLKGKLVAIGFVSYIIAGMIEAVFILNIYAFFIDRFVLIFSAISFYGGFKLPSWMERLFLKRHS